MRLWRVLHTRSWIKISRELTDFAAVFTPPTLLRGEILLQFLLNHSLCDVRIKSLHGTNQDPNSHTFDPIHLRSLGQNLQHFDWWTVREDRLALGTILPLPLTTKLISMITWKERVLGLLSRKLICVWVFTMTTEDDKDMLDLTKASRRNPDWPDSSFLTPRTTFLPKSTTGTV